MPEIEVTVIVKKDGAVQFGGPQIARAIVNEAQLIEVIKNNGDGSSFVTIPGAGVVPAVQAFFLKADNPVNLKFASVGAADGILAFQGGGMIVFVGANIAAGAALNTLINNAGTAAANLRVMSAGT